MALNFHICVDTKHQYCPIETMVLISVPIVSNTSQHCRVSRMQGTTNTGIDMSVFVEITSQSR